MQKFDDDCPGCRPVLLSLDGKPLADDSEPMIVLMKVWDELTFGERLAFHEFTCKNSRAPNVMLTVQKIQRQFQDALTSVQSSPPRPS